MTDMRQINPFIPLLLGIATGAAFLIGLYVGYKGNSDVKTNMNKTVGEVIVPAERK
jgi:hypothetical protein